MSVSSIPPASSPVQLLRPPTAQSGKIEGGWHHANRAIGQRERECAKPRPHHRKGIRPHEAISTRVRAEFHGSNDLTS